MNATLQELAAAGCSVNIDASELLQTIAAIRMEEREAAMREARKVRSYTIKDVACMTGITMNGIRKAIRRGNIPTTQPLGESTTVYIPSDVVEDIVQRLRHGDSYKQTKITAV